MANEETASSRTLVSELLATAIYKRTQGRMVRQVTCGSIWLILIIGAWRFYETNMKELGLPETWSPAVASLVRYGIPGILLFVGGWIAYRAVNWPRFADFLISVEAELNKVSWPSKSELVKASLVVIFTLGFLAMILFAYDIIWQTVFTWIGIS